MNHWLRRWRRRTFRSAPFQVVVADPPWNFSDGLPGKGRGARKHYNTLAVEKIVDVYPWVAPCTPIVADNAVLLLWRVAAMQREALDVMEAWGFTQKSEILWLKRTVNGKRHFAMGRQTRMEHEICLIGTRGKMRAKDMSVRSTFMECGFCSGEGKQLVLGDGQEELVNCSACSDTGVASDTEILQATRECSPSIVFEDVAERKHSKKPRAFFGIVERLYGGSYLELFGRDRRPGWTVLGDEVGVET